jgi:hypothetical protein
MRHANTNARAKTREPEADAPKGWVVALETSICLDANGKEVDVPVEEWTRPPRAPRWSPSYEWARQMRKRWVVARRFRAPATTAVRTMAGAGREHRSRPPTGRSATAPQAGADPPPEPDGRSLSDGEERFIQFFAWRPRQHGFE